jgi:hypothetical protein
MSPFGSAEARWPNRIHRLSGITGTSKVLVWLSLASRLTVSAPQDALVILDVTRYAESGGQSDRGDLSGSMCVLKFRIHVALEGFDCPLGHIMVLYV